MTIRSAHFPAGIPLVKTSLVTRGRQAFQPLGFAEDMRTKYGDIVGFKVPDGYWVSLYSPDGAQEVLTADPSGYEAFWKQSFLGLTGPGSLWVLDGMLHTRERKLLSPSFQPRRYRQIAESILESTRAQTDSWFPGLEVSALNEMLAISLNVILRLVFGVVEVGKIERGKSVMIRLLKAVHPAIVFFPDLQENWFPLWRRYAAAKKEFSIWLRDIMTDRQNNSDNGEDILARMLSAVNEDGKPITYEDIHDELITILLAGHETTATALGWALYDLARHPDVLRKLRTEIDELGPDPEIEEVQRLPYLSAVCNETLRLHTLLAEVGRVASQPVNIAGHEFKAGTGFVLSIIAIHHDPEIYPAPGQFRPERFIERKYSPFEFLPFGGGHRRCLGAALSDYEMRIVLAEMVTHWEFEVMREEKDIRHDIAMGPKYGIPMRIIGPRRAPFMDGERE